MMFLVLFGVTLLVSSIGFKKYVWFISLGYGFSVCAIGITLTAVYFGQLFSPDKLGVLLKSAAKKKNPKRFVDTGLYRIVRCPNYFGELLIWTGIFVGGTTACVNVWQWIAAVTGYIGIVYVMFSGARRLEERQSRTYGNDPEYQAYFKKTPIMIPLIPLYSVIKWKWLVA